VCISFRDYTGLVIWQIFACNSFVLYSVKCLCLDHIAYLESTDECLMNWNETCWWRHCPSCSAKKLNLYLVSSFIEKMSIKTDHRRTRSCNCSSVCVIDRGRCGIFFSLSVVDALVDVHWPALYIKHWLITDWMVDCQLVTDARARQLGSADTRTLTVYRTSAVSGTWTL